MFLNKTLRLIPLLLVSLTAAERKFQYVKIQSPCAVDRDTKRLVARAILDRDTEALTGLVERGKVLVLERGVRFEPVVPEKDGFVWGWVRSGRQVGRDCYMVETFLQDNPPD